MTRASFSGKFVLRVSPDLHQSLHSAAKQRHLSLNAVCSHLLATSLRVESSPYSEVVDVLRRLYVGSGMTAIYLFGSEARGTATESSDIDLLIVFNENIKITRSFYRKWDELMLSDEDHSLSKFSIHCVSLPADLEEVGSLWLEVALEGIRLFEDGKKVSNYFSKVRNLIAEGQYVRRKIHGHGVWKREQGAV